MATEKKDKTIKIELPYEDAVNAFMRTPPPKSKATKKKNTKRKNNQ